MRRSLVDIQRRSIAFASYSPRAKSVASHTCLILRCRSNSRSSKLSLFTCASLRRAAVIASVARRFLVLLSCVLPKRFLAWPAARLGLARRAAAVHNQCPVERCQVVLDRMRRRSLGWNRLRNSHWLNTRSDYARGVVFTLGFFFGYHIGGQKKAN